MTVFLSHAWDKEFTDRLDEAEWTLVSSEPGMTVEHGRMVIGLPWPLGKRESMIISKRCTNPQQGIVHVAAHSDDTVPEGKITRVNVHTAAWRFKALGGDRTTIEVEACVDPMLPVPAFLLNLVQEGWAKSTLQGFIKVCQKHGEKRRHPEFVDWK